jgi:hypothetical protein
MDDTAQLISLITPSITDVVKRHMAVRILTLLFQRYPTNLEVIYYLGQLLLRELDRQHENWESSFDKIGRLVWG